MPVASSFNTTMPSFGGAQTFDPNAGIQQMTNLVNLQQQALALRKAQDTYGADVAGKIADSIARQADASVATQTVQPRVNTAAQTSNQSDIATKKAQLGLTSEQAAIGQNAISALASDPDVAALAVPAGQPGHIDATQPEALTPVIAKLAHQRDLMVQSGVPKDTAEIMYSHAIQELSANPAAFQQNLVNTIQKNVGAQGQASQTLVPASGAQAITTDAAGNPIVAGRAPIGGAVTAAPLPVQGQSQAQPVVGALPPGAAGRIPALNQELLTAKNVALNAPTLHTTNQGILREIDKTVATGQAGPTIQKILSATGAAFGTPEEKASAYDMVGKYLERNALTAAQGMGPSTNAGLEAQIKANGSVAYNPTAIKEITKLNDALVSGTEAYYPALQKAIAANPQQGVLAKEQFDQQWASVFKPEVMQLVNAAKSGDKTEVQKLVQQAGGKGSAGAADLIKRAQGIDALVANGKL
jgi:hypothetical protein